MAIKVYKATDIKFGHLSWLLYGFTGAGKTTLIGTFPGPIAHINFTQEKGAFTLRGHPGVTVIDVTSPADVPEAVNYVVANYTQFKTVALDSVSTWCEILYRDQASRGKVEWNHWKNWKSLVFSVVERLRSLPLEVVIAAGLSSKEDDARESTRGTPAVFNSLKDELPSRVEVFVYLESETDPRGYAKFRAYPSGKGAMGGRTRGTLPSGPIDSPSYAKLVAAISKPLFSAAGQAPLPTPPPEQKAEDTASTTGQTAAGPTTPTS